MRNRGLANLTDADLQAALSVPVEQGPVVFIAAPWILNNPASGRTYGLYSGAPSVVGEGW